MITERGKVVALDKRHAWIQSAAQSGCRRCAEGRGCGGGVFARLLGDRLHRVRVVNSVNAREGDEVLIGLRESALLTGALLTYAMPVALLIAGALLAQPWGDFPALLGAAAGLGIGMLALAAFSRRSAANPRYQPELLEKLDSGCRFRRAADPDE